MTEYTVPNHKLNLKMREINCLLCISDTKIVLTIFQDQKNLHVGYGTRDPRHDKSCLWHMRPLRGVAAYTQKAQVRTHLDQNIWENPITFLMDY